jgi:1-phosphofructokinase family hexose kinase
MMDRAPRCVVISPNVAVDSYYVVDGLVAGEVIRATWSSHTAGGKGINMARAYRTLGGEPLCIGVVGGASGDFIEAELKREGIPGQFVRVAAETRRTTSIIERDRGCTTVVADPGIPLDSTTADELMATVDRYGRAAEWVALVGSLPPGFPDTYVADLVGAARAAGQIVAVDTSGSALRHALRAGPQIVKVNRLELADLAGHAEDGGIAWLSSAFRDLQSYGGSCLIVTDGRHGAYVLADGVEPFTVSTTVPRVVSAVGAGDTFLAAFIRSLQGGADIQAAAIDASAGAAANVQQVGCGVIDLADLSGLRARTTVHRPIRVAA